VDPARRQQVVPGEVGALKDVGCPFGDDPPRIVCQIGVVPARIDIMTEISGVTFSEAWGRRVVLAIEGQSLAFLGREDLVRNKQAAGRPKDLTDLAALQSDGR
jgi:hypothetical protein